MTKLPSAPVELRAGAMRLALRPDLGGSVAGLWMGETPVLRSVEPSALKSPRQSGCFALVPYSNRLGYKHFRWQGREYTTAANFGDDYPHSLHGSAWLQPWRVTAQDERSVELSYTQLSDAHWPFTFDVTQRFELTDNALMVHLHFTNIDAHTQPVGLGWYPYFPKRTAAACASNARAAGSRTPTPICRRAAWCRPVSMARSGTRTSTTASRAGVVRRVFATR